MNFSVIGWQRSVRGLREGDQTMLITGIALVLFQYLRSSKPKRKLLYHKTVPIGSTIVVRHAHRGDPKLEIHKPPKVKRQS